MVVQPVGPRPASTYWRRRAVLLGILLGLLFLLARCTGGGSSPTAAPGSSPTPSARGLASPSPSPSPSTAPAPTPSPATAPTTPASPVAAGLCPDSVLTLATGTDAATYPLGTSPVLTLTVRNSGSVACRRDLGTAAVELLVYSGSDRIWSSDDCTSTTGSDVVLLAPGATRAVKLTWYGKRSKPGCAGGHASAQPGTYRVIGRVGTLRREGASFSFA